MSQPKPFVDPDAGKAPEVLFAERSKRFDDAIALRQPDRIPINLGLSYLLAEMYGMTKQELHENPEKAQEALEKAAQYFQADAVSGVFGGPDVGLALGDTMIRWPGHGVSPNSAFQFVEKEYMTPEDYDDFIFDPGDWGIRKLLPRTATRLTGLAKLPDLGMLLFGTAFTPFGILNDPEVKEAFQALQDAKAANERVMARAMDSGQRLAKLGFPMSFINSGMVMASAPFDAMSDTLRGMKGIMLDMHRRPDKLLAAIDVIRQVNTRDAIRTCKTFGFKYAGSMLHRGSDGFMSLKQFEKFYWPSLKQMWLELIDNGITPFIFYEGNWDQRLQYLAELPKGKTIGMFQSSDIFKVKEVLGDTMCILGGMPNSMLQGGTVEQVRDWTKQLCEKVGKGGGYIMGVTIGEMEGSKPELVKAWVDATKEFGQY